MRHAILATIAIVLGIALLAGCSGCEHKPIEWAPNDQFHEDQPITIEGDIMEDRASIYEYLMLTEYGSVMLDIEDAAMIQTLAVGMRVEVDGTWEIDDGHPQIDATAVRLIGGYDNIED